MRLFKKLLLRLPIIEKWNEKGFFNKIDRRNLFLFLFFRLFFGLNREAAIPVHFTSIVINPSKIKIGKNVHRSFLNSNGCYFQPINGIFIDDDTIIAPGVKIISANHDSSELNKHSVARGISIGKNCWLGANSVILPGVYLGDNTIVAAGAVVTKSFENGNVVIKGIPAR